MGILLSDIWQIDRPADYKLHYARRTPEGIQPLEVWARDTRAWQQWQEYRPARDEFNRPLIFSLMQFYHEPDIWLFGGIWQVLAREPDGYQVQACENGDQFIGRLKLRSAYRERSTRVNFENHSAALEVQEILREPYSGRTFPGYYDIDLSFEELETLVRNSRPDWKAALENVKGIYLITDTRTGRRYVGSASGDQGVWSRWCAYVLSGHGGNVELRKLVTDPSFSYCRANFRFALLEHREFRVPDDLIRAREAFWKRILFTRGDQGLNRN